MLPVLPSGSDGEILEITLRKLTSDEREREGAAMSEPGLWVSLNVLQGGAGDKGREEGVKGNIVVAGGRPVVARKMGFPELILPNDVRNDPYVNIFSTELSRLNKT